MDIEEIGRNAEAAFIHADDAGRLRLVLLALDQIEDREELHLGAKREGVDVHAILAGPCASCPGFMPNLINHIAARTENLAADLGMARVQPNRRVRAPESCLCAISGTAEAARRAKRLTAYN